MERYHKPARSDYLWTYGATFTVLACNLLAYRLASHLLGTTVFAQFALGRRTLSYAYPLLSQGLGVALTRHVARSSDDAPYSDGGLLLAAAVIVLVGWVVLAPVALLFPAQLAYLFFGDSHLAGLILPLALTAAAIGLYTLAYNFLTGKMAMARASLLFGTASGLFPVMVLLFLAHTTAQIFLWSAAGFFGLGALALATVVRRLVKRYELGLAGLRRHGGVLLRYGLPRVPGALALSALLALPATLSAHWSGMEVAGMVSLGGTLLSIAGATVSPLTIILLPQSSRMLIEGGGERLRVHAVRLMKGIVALMTVGVAAGVFLARPVLSLYLGKELANHYHVILWMLPAVIPYALFCCFRSILDGAYTRAVNAENAYASLVVFAAVAGIARLTSAQFPVLVGFLAATASLGLLTVWRTLQVFDKPLES